MVQICQWIVKQLIKLIVRLPSHLRLWLLKDANCTFSVHTKRSVYNVVVVSVLLYGAEILTLKAPIVGRLTAFCVCAILGVNIYVKISTVEWVVYLSTTVSSVWHALVHCW